MKKKFTTIITTFLCLLFSLAAFSACDFLATVPDERTPYDVAVSEGYEGSWESWLSKIDGTSSRERQWYEEAVAAGEFTGTFAEFLKEIEGGGDVSGQALRSVVSVYAEFATVPMQISAGSGVLYSLDAQTGDAYIVTNYHVLYQAGSGESERIFVYLYEHETFSGGAHGDDAIPATLVGKAVSSDIAVLKVTGASLLKGQTYRAAEVENSDAVTVGETAYAVGNPLGMGLSVAKGIVSVTRENVTASVGTLDGVILPEIRTDAPINHGNSGGGLFSSKGKLIGIVNARRESVPAEGGEQSVTGIGYALPVNYAFAVAENIIANEGECLVAHLGLKTEVLSETKLFDEQNGRWNIEEKIVVFSTLSMNGAGYTAGLRNGDTLISATLTHADGTQCATAVFTQSHKIDDILLRVCRNDTLTIVVSREGKTLSFPVKFDRAEYFTAVL